MCGEARTGIILETALVQYTVAALRGADSVHTVTQSLLIAPSHCHTEYMSQSCTYIIRHLSVLSVCRHII